MLSDAATFAAISASVVGAFAGVALVGVRAHAYWSRVARPITSPQLDERRLMRLELAVDAIAVEVERIGEGQRFLTRLRAEPTGGRAPDAESGSADDRAS
jgi:hypothetical protein